MPLIHAIEVSNFMNTRRRTPWTPDWPCNRFLLGGYHSVFNIPNGGGKSAMVLLILAMLAGKTKKVNELMRKHGAPEATGAYTHIRIEITHRNPDPQDLLQDIVGPGDGERRVFGIYGNSKDHRAFEYYGYRGTFADCPTGVVTGPMTDLVTRDEFLECLRKRPGLFPANPRERQDEEWKRFVSEHFDTASIQQQYAYQDANAAEGAGSYFDVNSKTGDYGALLFYKHLAPELLADVMGGYGEEDERGIEDTIHEKASSVVRAQRRTKETAQELQEAERILDRLRELEEEVQGIDRARLDLDATRQPLITEICVLEDAILKNPIPGSPRPPAADDPDHYHDMLLQRDEWWITDQGLSTLLSEPVKRINQRAYREVDAHSETTVQKTQAIDLTCDLARFVPPRGGHAAKLYSLPDAHVICLDALNGKPLTEREEVIAQLNSAFFWARNHADTNPARIEVRRGNHQLSAMALQNNALNQEARTVNAQVADLEAEEDQLRSGGSAWEMLQQSKCFTEQELADPTCTFEKVTAENAAAGQAFDDHNQITAARQEVLQQWQAFQEDHGDQITPGALANDLEREQADAKLKAAQTLHKQSSQKELVAFLHKEHELLRTEAEQLRESLSTVIHHLPATQLFGEIFGDESTDGLDERVSVELTDAQAKHMEFVRELNDLSPAVKALATFTESYPNIAPDCWIDIRQAARKGLSDQESSAQLALVQGQDLLKRAEPHWTAASYFEHRFSGRPTEGLEAEVRNEFDRAKDLLEQNERALAALEPDLSAIKQFEQRFIGIHPRHWLEDRSQKSSRAEELIASGQQHLDSLLVRQQTVIKHRSAAEAFDTHFLGEDAYGLSGKVKVELASSRLRRDDFVLSLEHIRADLKAIQDFTSKVQGQEPGAWLQQWRTCRAGIELALAEKRVEQEQLRERRLALNDDPVVPTPIARAAIEIAGRSAQPLYVFVDSLDLSPERREAVLSLFSAMIFAPVLPDIQAGAVAATDLAKAQIDVPVLVAGPFATFCRSSSISYNDGIADGWLVGVKTWPVACLLEPALLKEECARLDVLLEGLMSETDALQLSVDHYTSHEPLELIAERAHDAVGRGIPERGERLIANIRSIDAELPKLERRCSTEALRTIESRIALTATLKLESNADWQVIQRSMVDLEGQVEELNASINEAQAALKFLNRDSDLEPVALIAANALRDDKPSQAELLLESITHICSALPNLEDRTSVDAVATIRAMANLQSIFQLSHDSSWGAVLEAHSMIRQDLAGQETVLQSVSRAVEEWEQALPFESVALDAVSALRNGASERYLQVRLLAHELNQLMPRLERRASFEARTSIHATRAVEQELNGQSLEELRHAADKVDRARRTTAKRVADNEEILYTLEESVKEAQQSYISTLEQARQVDRLRAMQEFVDHPEHGPEFMYCADQKRAALEQMRALAQRRASFSFEGVKQFVESGGSARLSAIRTELIHSANRTREIAETLTANGDSERHIRSVQEPLRRAAQMIDSSIIGIRSAYLERRKIIPDLVPISGEQLRNHPLYVALHPASPSSHIDLASSMDQGRESLLSEESNLLKTRYTDAGQALHRHSESFIKLIERVLSDSQLKLPQVARTQLRHARENPSLVVAMLQASQVSYEGNLRVNAIADKHLVEERAGLSSWLNNFTLRLPDNLKLLRSILAPKIDSLSKAVIRAGFDVQAKVIDSDGITALIESIIRDVENYEANEQLRESSLRDSQKKSLREDIRRNFYQKVIVNPRIHLVLPAMSAGPLKMERDMASSGQGIAITFLWILRLSEFIGEREIRRQTVGRAQRQRLRNGSTSFTILDGAFSHLSSKDLIDETLQGIEESTGRFQLIVTGHDPAYQNDFKRFPALIVGRRMQGHYMRAWSYLKGAGAQDALGQDSLATFQTIRVPRSESSLESKG